jgi:hypothetical protein
VRAGLEAGDYDVGRAGGGGKRVLGPGALWKGAGTRALWMRGGASVRIQEK